MRIVKITDTISGKVSTLADLVEYYAGIHDIEFSCIDIDDDLPCEIDGLGISDPTYLFYNDNDTLVEFRMGCMSVGEIVTSINSIKEGLFR